MNLEGKIEEIMPERTITEKFSVKEFVLRVDGKYPELILFQTSNQQMKILDAFMVGEMVNVHFNLRGRKVKDRFWNTLAAWKIEVVGKTDILPEQKESRNVHKDTDCNDQFREAADKVSLPPLPPAEDDGQDLPF